MRKRRSNLMDTSRGLIGAGLMLGVGSMALNQMGQGQTANQVITPATNMMGPLITAGFGLAAIDMISNSQTPKKKSSRYTI